MSNTPTGNGTHLEVARVQEERNGQINACLQKHVLTSPQGFAAAFMEYAKKTGFVFDNMTIDHFTRLRTTTEKSQACKHKKTQASDIGIIRGACAELLLQMLLEGMMQDCPELKERNMELLCEGPAHAILLCQLAQHARYWLVLQSLNCEIIDTDDMGQEAEFDAALRVGKEDKEFFLFDISTSDVRLKKKMSPGSRDTKFGKIRQQLQQSGVTVHKFHVAARGSDKFFCTQVYDGIYVFPINKLEEISKLTYAMMATYPNGEGPQRTEEEAFEQFKGNLEVVRHRQAFTKMY